MSERLHGVPAAPGAAIAAPWHYRPAVGGTTIRYGLDEAARRAARELEELGQRMRDAGNPDEAEILEAQAMMALDETLLSDARGRVAAGGFVVDAILGAGEEAAESLAALDDELLAARAADVRDVARRIARIAVGAEIPRLERRSIAIAEDLPPSVTAELERDLLAGIALESGSRTAHAAILARALRIPAVVGVAGLRERSAGAAEIAIDGDSGEVFVDPDDAQRTALERAALAGREREAADAALVSTPLRTADGHRVMLAANIGRQNEAAPALAGGAEGIGLFRTEFMFMGRSQAPDEDEQTGAYATVLSTFGDRPVVIRLIDLGGDKDLPYLAVPPEANPFLGVRAIRLARQDPDLILTQLRAILRAGARTGTTPWVMAPMVADAADVALLHELVDRAEAAVPDHCSVRRGIMVEIPSAVTLARELADEVDFLSIGTNDLTQYLLAADRTNPALADQQDALHPAVVRSIAAVVEAGRATGTHVAVCGELGGDPAGAVVLAGLGIAELSMEPSSFGPVKRAVGSVTLAEASELAGAAMQAGDAATARHLVDELLAARGAVAR
jgi:phosphoenolpyruvate-protein phosphotransferase